ncbi:hypothetical protein GCM10007390_47870 [Persicitalea jodogahamensis]|uniref:TonB-dependent receptor plug domain-containing protein n=2 Tax=Persicitalea jodogahamensis TaxID=402147 RepID=A0A8J3GC83_9BACT|nr:hypothetical protein GCM10007390_47870 [Persicitalea jodogahamensis]
MATNWQKPKIQNSIQENANSVALFLHRLELVHKVNFVYQKELVEGKQMPFSVNENDQVESILKRLLPPLNLRYKKLKGGGYTILPSQKAKSASVDALEPRIREGQKTTIELLDGRPGQPLLSNLLPTLVSIQVTGHVLDETTSEALPGVSVLLRGTQSGVTTDANGRFTISVPDKNAVLVFSYVGFVKQEVTVGNTTSLNIQLKADTKSLEEVVVVGFGTQKKINATGAIASMGTKELVQSPVANVSNSLVGRLPGLFATQGGGEPGNDASKLRIRGVGTFSGNTDPLTMVDGIQIDNINNIDPNEIESVTILKDASSTAVYGIRGANGVVIITTKRGKSGPPKISYTFNQGFNSFTDKREMMNSADYATNFNEAIRADTYVNGNVYVPRYTPEDIELYRNGTDPIFYPSVDWAAEMFKKVSTQSQHNVNISGGQNKVKYFVSAGFFNQEGLFKDTQDLVDGFSPQSTYRRYNVRSNFNFELTKRLKMSLDLSSQTEIRSGNNGSSTERVLVHPFLSSS